MAKTKENNDGILKIPVIRGKVLGVNVYRGFTLLHILAELSKADIYDEIKNPKGTQRDLSPKHAKDAYEYIKNSSLGFWPEVFLCARKKEILTFKPISEVNSDIGILEIDCKKINTSKKIAISRVDGNHRLHYADGVEKGYSKIDIIASFCIAFDLKQDEEIKLFKDINKNQKAMNTSHLDRIEVRLTKEEELRRRNPELYIAQKLGDESTSPLSGLVYQGGARPVGRIIPLRGLKTGIQYLLSQSTQLPHLQDSEAQFRVIKNYFNAIKKWQPEVWDKPKDFITLRGAGLWGICFLGAQVIDRALINAKFDTDSLLSILKSGKKWDWSNKGDFKGYSGRGGAIEISQKVARNLKDTNQISTEDLFKQIMGS